MDQTLNHVDEFIRKSQLFADASNKGQLKENEAYFDTFRRNNPQAFSVCCQVLSRGIDYNSTAFLFASQALCWICKRQATVIEQHHYHALLDIIKNLTDRGIRYNHPVITQLCLSVSSVVLHFSANSTNSSLTIQVIINDLISRDVSTDSILLIISTIPELFLSLREYLFPISNDLSGADKNQSSSASPPHIQHGNFSEYADRKNGPSSVNEAVDMSARRAFQLKERLLRESSVVEQLAANALLTGDANSHRVRAVLQCCTQWVEFISQSDATSDNKAPIGNTQHFKKKSPPPTAAVRLSLDASLVGSALSGWLGSSVLQHAVRHMVHSIHSLSTHCEDCEAQREVFDVSCELLGALCETGRDGPTTGLSAALAVQMLPVLSSLLQTFTAAGSQVVNSLFASRGEGRLALSERFVQHALAVTRMVSECGVSLLSSLAGSEAGDSVGVVSLWSALVTDFVAFLQSQVSLVQFIPLSAAAESSSEQSELTASLREYCQELVESAMTFWLPLTQRVNSADHLLLQALFNGHIQSLLIVAVQVSAYVERPDLLCGALSLQHQESAGEYRSFLREALREVVVAVPSVADWLLDSCLECVAGYVTTVSAVESNSYDAVNNVGDLLQLGVGWALSEALLHAVTAITKYVLIDSHRATVDQIRRVYSLLYLLSTSTVATHCRPLARMSVVLISELLPGLIRASTASAEMSAQDSIPSPEALRQLFRASVNYLLLSVTVHGECASQHDGHRVASSEGSSTATLSERVQHDLLVRNTQSSNTLHLEIQGWFLVFRVKQDHIGAVSLCKLFTAVYVVGEYSSVHQIQAARFIVSPVAAAEGNPSRLVLVATSLFDMQQRAGTDSYPLASLAGAMRRAYFTVSPQHDTTSAVLAYCLHYLTVLQTSSDRLHAPCITSKSFNLVYFALCTALSSTICNDPLQAQGSAMGAMNQIAAPTAAAVVALLIARRHTSEQSGGSENELNALLTQLTAPLFPMTNSNDEHEANNRSLSLRSATSVGLTLSRTCSLPQLLLMLNELVVTSATHLWGESTHAGKKNPATAKGGRLVGDFDVPIGAHCNTQLTLIEALLPTLSFLAQHTPDGRHPFIALLSFAELEATNKLVMALCALPLSAALSRSSDVSLSIAVGQRVYLLLNELYSALHALLLSTHQQSPLLIQAACQLMRTLCSWRSVVDITALFQRMFQEVSQLGILSLQSGTVEAAIATSHAITSNNNSMNIHRVNKRDKRTLQRLNSNKHEYGVLLLCEYWAVCLSASELLPVNRLSVDAVSTSQISVDLMGWAALQSIVDTACAYILQANHDAVMCYSDDESDATKDKDDEKATFGTATWRQVVGILTLVMGPVVRQEGCGAQQSELATLLAPDGHLTGNAAKSIWCGETPCGQPELIDLLVRSDLQLVDRLFKSLLCGISGSLPSDLREELSKALQKAFVCFGTQLASQSAIRALFDSDYPVNGSVMSEEGKTSFVSQLQSYALGGDWKRWKNIVKVLSKG